MERLSGKIIFLKILKNYQKFHKFFLKNNKFHKILRELKKNKKKSIIFLKKFWKILKTIENSIKNLEKSFIMLKINKKNQNILQKIIKTIHFSQKFLEIYNKFHKIFMKNHLFFTENLEKSWNLSKIPQNSIQKNYSFAQMFLKNNKRFYKIP